MVEQNRNQPDQEYRDHSQISEDSSERDRSNREPASVADDRGPGRDSVSDDLESEELGSALPGEASIDDLDNDDSDASSRSNR